MTEYPKCKLCDRGELLPLDTDEASAWVCSNPSCGFYIELIGKRVKMGRAKVEEEKGEGSDKEG